MEAEEEDVRRIIFYCYTADLGWRSWLKGDWGLNGTS
jgi:hypothetical protein